MAEPMGYRLDWKPADPCYLTPADYGYASHKYLIGEGSLEACMKARTRLTAALAACFEAGRRAGMERAAEIADGHASCEGIAQRIAADIRGPQSAETSP